MQVKQVNQRLIFNRINKLIHGSMNVSCIMNRNDITLLHLGYLHEIGQLLPKAISLLPNVS